MFHRSITISNKRSFFLFGARGTGKSTFIKKQFLAEAKNLITLDLLDPELEDELARNPSRLRARLQRPGPKPEWIFIDEVQKVPRLLDMVHKLIEDEGMKFILTGSSARKLKRGAANLLAGRATLHHLHPLTTAELGDSFSLDAVLHWGSLPSVSTVESTVAAEADAERRDYLRSYAFTYLKEEIQAEQLIKKLAPFRNFLPIAAQMNGKILNYSSIARQVGTDTKTVQSYYEILEDTLVGFRLPGYSRSVRKQQASHPKFYLFDPGVKRALDRTWTASLTEGTSAYGEAFEHWVVLEFFRQCDYFKTDHQLSYLRTKDDAEVDLILSRPGDPDVLIEIKSAERVDPIAVRKLRRISEAFPKARSYYLSRDPLPQKIEGVECLHWRQGLAEIVR
jgi:uncharacterized protein